MRYVILTLMTKIFWQCKWIIYAVRYAKWYTLYQNIVTENKRTRLRNCKTISLRHLPLVVLSSLLRICNSKLKLHKLWRWWVFYIDNIDFHIIDMFIDGIINDHLTYLINLMWLNLIMIDRLTYLINLMWLLWFCIRIWLEYLWQIT